jgi:hypothetical protein
MVALGDFHHTVYAHAVFIMNVREQLRRLVAVGLEDFVLLSL